MIQCEPLGPDGKPLPAPKKAAKPSSSDAQQSTGTTADSARAGSGKGAIDPKVRRLGLGSCLVHLRYNYRGIVIGYDPQCKQSDAWIRANGVDELKHGRNQPFYHVLTVRPHPCPPFAAACGL